MLDITKASTDTVGEMAGEQIAVATLEKIRKFVKFCYGKNSQEYELVPGYAKRYFSNALDSRFDNATALYYAMPDTESTEYEDQEIYNMGYFAGYLAGVIDADKLHNEIELPAGVEEKAPQS